jgi:hypothetical protein
MILRGHLFNLIKEKRKQATARRMYALIGPIAVSEDALESLDGERKEDRA